MLAGRQSQAFSRCLSSVSGPAPAVQHGKPSDGKLPLEGYRVLDMTRVLAGVRQILWHTCLAKLDLPCQPALHLARLVSW